MTIQQILDKRAAAFKAMEAVQTRSKEAGAWTTDDEAQYRAAEADFDKWDTMYRNESRLQEIRKMGENDERDEMNFPGERRSDSQEREPNEADQLWAYFRYLQGAGVLSAKDQKAISKRFAKEGRFGNLWESRGTATIATDVTDTKGGYLVPVSLWTQLERVMKMYGGMLQASRVINTQDGGLLNWPTNDDTGNLASWQVEPRTAALAVQDMVFDRKQFNAFTLSTLAKFTIEILQDENVNLFYEQFVDILGERLGRALNLAFTTGDGSGKPTGILHTSGGAGVGVTTAGTTFTKGELIDLQHTIDPAYRMGPNVAFMFNDATLAAIRKLDLGTTDNVPLWQPSFAQGQPDRILGVPYVINNNFPNIAAGNRAIAFGDWSKYIIREVQRPSAVVLNERFMDELHKGVVMYARYDGKLLVDSAIKVLRIKP